MLMLRKALVRSAGFGLRGQAKSRASGAAGASGLLRQPRLDVNAHLPMAMHFSSSSPNRSPPSKPSILDGVDGLLQYSTRCTERTAVFERYEREGVFQPSSFRFSNFFLFTKLQVPANTEIDAVDFLHGAQFACDLAMNTMYSREFINFACGAITESKAADHLKRGLSPECFEAFLYAMNESSKTGNTFDLKQLISTACI